jgi:hypothetical protein
MKYYSEHGEDKWIMKNLPLPKKGVYVDIGAAHPTRMSNTAFLRDMGWTGIQVDADPYWKPYWRRAGLPLLCVPVWTKDTRVKFTVDKKAHRLSTINSSGKVTSCMTIKSVCELVEFTHIDFMSLDVEGAEFDVFKVLDKKLWPDILVVEYDTLGTQDFRLRNYLNNSTYYKEVLQTNNNFVFFHTNRLYDYHRTCWRYTYGYVDASEKHPCYFCGYDLPMKIVDKIECKVCGTMVCPSCHGCLCTISDLQYNTLIRLHKKYCCNLPKYKGVVELAEPYDSNLTNGFVKAINVCFEAEKKNGNIQ